MCTSIQNNISPEDYYVNFIPGYNAPPEGNRLKKEDNCTYRLDIPTRIVVPLKPLALQNTAKRLTIPLRKNGEDNRKPLSSRPLSNKEVYSSAHSKGLYSYR